MASNRDYVKKKNRDYEQPFGIPELYEAVPLKSHNNSLGKKYMYR